MKSRLRPCLLALTLLFTLVGALGAPAAARTRLPVLSLSSPATIVEGDEGTTEAIFAVRLSGAARRVVSVRFATSDLTATRGQDYLAVSGTLLFKPGERSKRIVVRIVGDHVAEDGEAFSVSLSRARNARLHGSAVTGRIAPSDLPAPFSVVADLKASDGPGTGHAMITLDAAKGQATFTLEIRNSPRNPIAVHVHSQTQALGGTYPSLEPVPPADGVSTGTISVPRRTILLMDANLADFYVEVHTVSRETSDLSGDLRRVPAP